ncbi:EAL and HDOD domain-containing protein [Clostridium sp. MT-14]|uniref:HDOD domain-containing protein n=1 Tax=Clostridium aromativorans TaxID=2836848 RepID=A0ABS8NAC8_9CLOT|nr:MULTISPECIES: HDOD domain-containing protein [Clostridium]KAA8675271.1 HDOD domain-containing protein [Clostridium sp. HV4-5-A1G]MCC9296757.1 HDOD domain-containing protein [Clostridium aromativorans]CAB1262625.1 Phage resistance protein [Clostridiaceae bacterium BL-3]
MDIFLARQPILDKSGKVFGYEILFRDNESNNQYDTDDGDGATIKVMQNTLVNIGIDKIVGNKKAFINFTKTILKSDLFSIISPKNVVIEVLENIIPTEEVINSCRVLKEKGFTIALDDFVFDDTYVELLKLVDIVKIDFLITRDSERKKVMNTAKNINPNLKFIAEKVETLKEFNEAVSLGYSYFQGYYFSKPQIIKGAKIPVNKVIYLNLIRELNSKEFSIENIENLIKKDISLSYDTLKLINSAKYSFENKISSIKQAIVLLGEKEIKRWLYFICMKPICDDKPQIVMIESLLRAEFSELLAKKTKLRRYSFYAYLTGIMSLMDVILQKPLREILDELMIPQDVKCALLGRKSNFYSKILDIAVAYQKGEWGKSMLLASHLGIDKVDLASAYIESIKWLDEVVQEI